MKLFSITKINVKIIVFSKNLCRKIKDNSINLRFLFSMKATNQFFFLYYFLKSDNDQMWYFFAKIGSFFFQMVISLP